MSRRIRDYIKYTPGELTKYTETSGSCMKKINTDLHLNLPPSGLANLKKSILDLIADKKIGLYDQKLKGIILDVRNIKVIGNSGAMRFDDPLIHLNIRADCYYFHPTIGSVVKGVVRHISSRQLGVIIFRVFSVTIRLNEHQKQLYGVEMNSEIEFRIKNFDLENMMPYIEGELVAREVLAVKKEFKDEEGDEEDVEEDTSGEMTNGNCQDDERKKSLYNQDSEDWSELRSIIKTEKEEQQGVKSDEGKTPAKKTPLKGILKKTTPPPTPETETPLTNGKTKKKKRKLSDLDESMKLLLAKVKKEKESESESEKTPRKKKKVVENGT